MMKKRKTEDEFRKLFDNVNSTHNSGLPWSATSLQIRDVYEVDESKDLAQIAISLSKISNSIVFLCHELPDAADIETKFDISNVNVHLVDELTLYAVPADLLWKGDGEHYRKALPDMTVQGYQFRCVFVCYRNSEAVEEQSPYTCFLELHLYKREQKSKATVT
jgi:hypothetical protein